MTAGGVAGAQEAAAGRSWLVRDAPSGQSLLGLGAARPARQGRRIVTGRRGGGRHDRRRESGPGGPTRSRRPRMPLPVLHDGRHVDQRAARGYDPGGCLSGNIARWHGGERRSDHPRKDAGERVPSARPRSRAARSDPPRSAELASLGTSPCRGWGLVGERALPPAGWPRPVTSRSRSRRSHGARRVARHASGGGVPPPRLAHRSSISGVGDAGAGLFETDHREGQAGYTVFTACMTKG